MLFGFIIVTGIFNLIVYIVADDPSKFNLVAGIIMLALIPVPFFMVKLGAKKLAISDEEIMEQIRKHKKCSIGTPMEEH